MATGGRDKFWALVTLSLIVVIVIGGVIVWQHYRPADPVEIILAEASPDAGGTVSEADSQKIDINRAEAWLLEALPGIGPSKAQAIIDYRQQHGYFSNTYEITNVPGISTSMYQNFKDMLTVSD
ncbi:MAG: helix-hairpin-helix domain-containing protein [Dehalococcoidia bacterium]